MKLILLTIFIIIFNSISSINLRPADIFKGDKSRKNFNRKYKVNAYKSPKCYTGFPGISCDKDLGLEKERFFIACCVIGGLTRDKQIINAYKWAKDNNLLINDEKPYKEFAKKISAQFKTQYHDDWKIKEPAKGIFLVENSKEAIFNSAGFEKIFKFNPIR